MLRRGLAILTLAGLAACSENDASRKVIVDQCLADGGVQPVCDCLGNSAVARLDKELLDIIILGAQGKADAADQKMSELAPNLRNKFAAEIPAIQSECASAATPPPPES